MFYTKLFRKEKRIFEIGRPRGQSSCHHGVPRPFDRRQQSRYKFALGMGGSFNSRRKSLYFRGQIHDGRPSTCPPRHQHDWSTLSTVRHPTLHWHLSPATTARTREDSHQTPHYTRQSLVTSLETNFVH